MTKKVVLAGGCFWGLEDLIRKQVGVIDTKVGYTGGSVENPTYDNHAGHAEAVEIEYDDEKTTYKKLLDFFFQIHNPTTLNQQGNDRGTSYRSAIFYHSPEQKTESAKSGLNTTFKVIFYKCYFSYQYGKSEPLPYDFNL